MTTINNPFQAMNSLFLKPNQVFAKLGQVNNWSWVPFFILCFAGALLINAYFNFVDMEWYSEAAIAQSYGDLSPAEQQMRKDQMTSETVSLVGIVMVILGPIIVNAIYAAYLNAMTRSDESNVQGFTDWYGATWWLQLPSLINTLLGLLILLMATDPQLSPINLTPLSLGFLLNTEMQSPWFNFMTAIRLDTLWSIYLLVVCLAQWTQFDSRKCLIIAIAPHLVIFSLWFAFLTF